MKKISIRYRYLEEGRIDEIYRVSASFFLFCTSKMATVKITIQISNYEPIFLSNPKPSFKNGATAVTAHSVRVLISSKVSIYLRPGDVCLGRRWDVA